MGDTRTSPFEAAIGGGVALLAGGALIAIALFDEREDAFPAGRGVVAGAGIAFAMAGVAAIMAGLSVRTASVFGLLVAATLGAIGLWLGLIELHPALLLGSAVLLGLAGAAAWQLVPEGARFMVPVVFGAFVIGLAALALTAGSRPEQGVVLGPAEAPELPAEAPELPAEAPTPD